MPQTQLNQNLWGWAPRHQYFLKLPRQLQGEAKFEYHWWG